MARRVTSTASASGRGWRSTPGYVPDLNPDEGVWEWTKYGRLANLAANDKDELWDHVVDQLVEVKFPPDLLRGFIR
ncbi:MAG TPA: hypothetical protein VKE74_33165 [Gemmataceae bacterium]|nr:hypothetical protein [Gemmataceae bacterium]